MSAPTPVALGADDLAALRALVTTPLFETVAQAQEARLTMLAALPALLDAIEALQAQVEADAADKERLKEVVGALRQQRDHFDDLRDAAQSALSDERAASAAMKAALQEIAEQHVPVQPMALNIPEADYIQRCHTELRRVAVRALALHTAAGERRDDR